MKMKEIVAAIPEDKNVITIQFSNGERFSVDFKPFIKSGISDALSDPDYFRQVKAEHGYITWPNGYDFCPEFLYQYATQNL